MATFAHVLERRGPAITAIANEMGVSPETARYWYKGILSRRGFALQASLDEQKFGLKRVFTISDLDEKYWPYARDIFHALYNYLGLGYYTRLSPSGKFALRYLIPADREQELLQALHFLKREGIFRSIVTAPMEWKLFLPMKSEYYNFSKGAWEFDWKDVVSRWKEELEPPGPSKPVRLDYSDLLVAKELQINAARSLQAVAKQLEMKYDAAFRHHRHLIRRKLILGYKLRWVESSTKNPEDRSKDYRDTPVYQAQHKYAAITALLTGLTVSEESNTAKILSRIPFLFNMYGGNGNLSFEVFIPFTYQADTLSFLREVLSPYRNAMEFSFTDQTFAQVATIPYEMYDAEKRAWTYRARECIEDFKDFFPRLQKAQKAMGAQ